MPMNRAFLRPVRKADEPSNATKKIVWVVLAIFLAFIITNYLFYELA